MIKADIDKLVFTGSVATGKRIAQAAAARLLPVVLELGGKDPMLVLDDADIEIASRGAVWGAFVNAGQACLSVERCYVHRSLYEPFLEACVRQTEQIASGQWHGSRDRRRPDDPRAPVAECGIAGGRCTGAGSARAGGWKTPAGNRSRTFTRRPVLADVTHEMRIMREETFGPVLPVMPFDSDEEAIRLANDSDYGLAASVWTRDRARGDALARRIQAGTVMVNDAVSCFGISEAPHGGVKASGMGRSHGRFGLEEMVRIKYLDSDRLAGHGKNLVVRIRKRFHAPDGRPARFSVCPRIGQRLRGAVRAAGALKGKKRR